MLLSSGAIATQNTLSEHAQKTLEIYTRIIGVESSKNLGNVPKVAKYLADELLAAGFPEKDVEIVPLGETVSLIARYRGDGSSGKAPILLLGHMDVVEALLEDNDMTLAYFQETGKQLGGDLGNAMIGFADNPQDKAASDRLAMESSYVGTTRTTCVVTMLQAGHAENALPQSATATINCRVFPGVPVGDIETILKQVIGNDAIDFKQLEEATESPISELRSDVVAAVSKAVHTRYPDVKVIAYLESGGTDGMHFRKAGIPTWAVSGLFMNPDEMYAHGLNERVPIKAFYDALDHWSIILRELASN